MGEIKLNEKVLDERVRKSLSNHYERRLSIPRDYIDSLWERFSRSPSTRVYEIMREEHKLGYLIFDEEKSNIEEILLEGDFSKKDVFFSVIDHLISEKSLISITLSDVDKEKRELAIAYGFRPSRVIKEGGMKKEKFELSQVVYFERLKVPRQIRPYEKKETVVIEKIERIEEGEIEDGLRRVFENLGGLNKYVKGGERILLKPNLVADHGMVGGKYKGGVVTDLRLVEALIKVIEPYASEIIVAEGSSINRSATGKMFRLYGYDRLCEKFGEKVRLVDLNTDETCELKVPFGKRMEKRAVPKTILEADTIISIPVMKTHFAACVSLGVKNLQGVMPPLEKYMTHFFGLWQNLVNIHHLVKPRLTIVDGLIAQEDFGPVSGVEKPMNLIVAGENPVAVDATCMRIMGLDPKDSPPVFLAYIQGFGPIEEDKISVLGKKIEEVRSPFRLPVINITGGRDIVIHGSSACIGCKGYLHFVLHKLRRPDPNDPQRDLIDRPLKKKVRVYLGPHECDTGEDDGIKIFMGLCQSHNSNRGIYLPGCPPHAEVIIKGIFQFFPDVLPPKYADDTEEAKLERMLREILGRL